MAGREDRMDEIRNAKERLAALSGAQGNAIAEVISLLDAAEREPAAAELARLRIEAEGLRSALAEREKRLAALEREASLARNALREQLVDEKLAVLRLSKDKTDAYFRAAGNAGKGVLSGLEAEAKRRARALEAATRDAATDEARSLFREIEALEKRAAAMAERRRAELAAEEKRLAAEAEASRAGLAAMPVDEAVVAERARRNRLEMKLGAGWLGRIGIFLVVVAVALFGYWARGFVNAYVKGALIFLLGALLVGAGEFLYRKKKAPLHEIFLGGGIAVLYLAAFLGHFVLKYDGEAILGILPALAVCVFITIASVLLSLRYSSRTVLCLSAVGGYLPFAAFLVAFGFEGNQHYYAMGYLLLLNALVMGVGLAKDWPIATYILFALGTPSISFLVMDAPSPLAGLACVALSFGTFLASVFLRALFRKRDPKAMDLVLLGLDTAIASVLVYALFHRLGWDDRYGLLSLGFAAAYLGAGFLSGLSRERGRRPGAIFFLTSLAFAALAVPFQFGVIWMSLGWLAEAVLLAVFGYKLKIRIAEIGGWVLLGLCAGAFIVVDLPLQFEGLVYAYLLEAPPLFGVIPMFGLKWLALSAALAGLSLYFAFERGRGALSPASTRGKAARVLSYVAIPNLVAFSLHAVPTWLNLLYLRSDAVADAFSDRAWWFVVIAGISLSFRLASSLARRTPLAADRPARWIGYVLLVIGDAIAGFATLDPDRLDLEGPHPMAVKALSAVALVALNAGIVLDARYFLSKAFRKSGKDAELYPLLTAIIAAECLGAFVLCQSYGVPKDILLAVVLFAEAVACIWIGFRRRYSYIRFLGLGFIGIAMIILFASVFRETDILGKIIAFLVLGLALIGVSWGYAKIDRKLKETVLEKNDGKTEGKNDANG